MNGHMLLRWFCGFALFGLLAGCAGTAGESPKHNVPLPLAMDKPTFLWFFTDP